MLEEMPMYMRFEINVSLLAIIILILSIATCLANKAVKIMFEILKTMTVHQGLIAALQDAQRAEHEKWDLRFERLENKMGIAPARTP